MLDNFDKTACAVMKRFFYGRLWDRSKNCYSALSPCLLSSHFAIKMWTTGKPPTITGALTEATRTIDANMPQLRT